jgi:biotin synthase-like enzyme
LFNTDWIDFTKDLKILNNEVNNKELRVLLNLSNIEYDDDVIKISNICEQENIKTIILGSSNYNLRVFDNIINMTKIIKENTSLKVGMFGGFNNTDLINKMHHHNVSPILVNPLNILSLFK